MGNPLDHADIARPTPPPPSRWSGHAGAIPAWAGVAFIGLVLVLQ
ncbi:hypothetical protein QT882_09110 [Xanthomonas fragariae]|nr:hypothetical protein [Xanthomonas fragariae]MDM7554837.1 hypothetical protein [Xanthomonas fragariae]MDM7557983.1 hypothetical protein [Xanthomonas fragariae]MDM7572543.1 hypothetical protein [Xanthomonas fragariae]MDM7575660.1 hypothetical protein [Xanthomonas fragariae]MDM7578740.1 hypothetical protein [Xanthomonas fragariae]